MPILAETIAMLEPLAREHGVRVSVSATERAAYAHADSRWLRQALLNVVGNAIKYNHVGGAVLAEAVEVDGRLRILVHDTGPGIPQVAAERLFAPFDRLGTETSGVPGTGLGLTISKQFVEAMGGRLDVHSRGADGTTVAVELPARAH